MAARSKVVCCVVAGLLVISCSQPQHRSRIETADYHYQLAVNYYHDQNATAAIRELYTALKLNPKHVLSHNLLGLIYLGRRQYPDALRHLKEALRIDPKFKEAQANLGAVYLAMKDWRKALQLLEPLLSDPLYPTPYLIENNVGWAYFNLGNLREAERHFKQALFLNDKMCLAYNNLGMVYDKERRYDDAEEMFRAAIKRCPGYVEAYYRLATVLEKKGELAGAIKYYRKCKKLAEESVYGRECKTRLKMWRSER